MGLTSEEREFFSLIREATYANPFSDERIDIDLKIARLSPHVSTEERLDRVIAKIHEKVGHLEKIKGYRIDDFSGDDRELVINAYIFDVFHQFIDHFDDIIPKQIQAGEEPIRIPFARDALSIMHRRGFTTSDALRYFALCFQLRRAFFFIDRGLIGRSSCMKKLRKNLWNNVFTHNIGLYDQYLWNRMEDFSTLILGETGTGKGSSAGAIGKSGFIPFDGKKECFVDSFMRSFVSLNLSQFPESLIESELFGHGKGAFTGATHEHKGIFDQCSPYGAIFLDEIGEVSFPIQIKLLKVIQEREFSPVGSHEKRRFQGRVIAATNRSIKNIREKKILRDDFFYRLCSDIIVVPPLRDRIREDPGELDDLLSHTMTRILGNPSPELIRMVGDIIRNKPGIDYPWPGNVRELEQCIRSILIRKAYDGDMSGGIQNIDDQLLNDIRQGSLTVKELVSEYCLMLYRRLRTFEAVAKRTGLDRRTVKKYLIEQKDRNESK